MVPDWFRLLFLLVIGDFLWYELHALVLKSYQFDSQIVCIVGNRYTGNIYVQTKENLTMLDSGLRADRQQSCQLATVSTSAQSLYNSSRRGREDGYNTACKELQKIIRSECIVSERFEPMPNAVAAAYHDAQTSPSCTGGRTICDFPANQNHTFLIITRRQTTQLWQRNNHDIHNLSCTFVRTLQCELPDEVFLEASAGLFIKESNVSGSLFLTFVNNKNRGERAIKMSVTCEFRIGFDNPLDSETWTKPTVSRALPLNPRALLYTRFASRKALILVEPDDVLMQWLPVNERSVPQSILPNNFDHTIQRPMNVVDVILKENKTEVYVATDSMIRLIDLDNCYHSTTCIQCMKLGGTFCGWCISAKRCMYRQLCPLNNTIQSEGWWLNFSKSEDRCHTHSSTTKTSLAKRTTLRPKILKPHSKGNNFPVTESKDLLWNTPSSTAKAFDITASQAVHMGIGVCLSLIVLLCGMIAAVSIRYRRVRRDNIQTVNRVRHRFPECEGIHSYRQLRSLCLLLGRPAAVQFRYRRQMQHSGDTNENTDSALVI